LEGGTETPPSKLKKNGMQEETTGVSVFIIYGRKTRIIEATIETEKRRTRREAEAVLGGGE